MSVPRCLALGEAMLRFRMASGERLQDVRHLEVDVGGAELNAMIAATVTGLDARLLTKLPSTPLGERVVRHAAEHGVEVVGPRELGGRVGTYYIDAGPPPRGTEVIYDRGDSSFAHLKPGEFPLEGLLTGIDHVHVTGITFALGEGPAEAALELLTEARARDIPVSYDINYRAKLWSLEDAQEATQLIMGSVTTLFASPHDLAAFFAAEKEVPIAAEDVRDHFGLDRVVVSEREQAKGWTRCRVTIVADEVTRSDWIEAQIVDPIGAGDALAGVALGELLQGQDQDVAAAHAAAAAALQQTLLGDALVLDRAELALPGVDRQVRR